MKSIWTMGEMLVEIMRPRPDMDHDIPGEYIGPFPSGAPAIFIDTVARLGIPSGIIGGVGDDGFGRNITDRLEADGVDCRFVTRSAMGATAVAFVMYRSDGSREFIFHVSGTPACSVRTPEIPVDPDPGYFHIMGSSLSADDGFRVEILKTMEQFTTMGARVSFDPNIRPELLRGKNVQDIIEPVMAHCSILFPGIDELLLISRESTIDGAVRRLFGNPALELIVLKRGKNGCSVYTPNEHFDIAAFPIEPVDPVDPTGAGDCFDAAFLCGYMQGKSLSECARMATAAGTINAAKLGPMEGGVTIERIIRVIEEGAYRGSNLQNS